MKYVYLFNEGNKDLRNLLGGKGANLAEMTNIGLPVPKGFTITTEACNNYYENQEVILDEIQEEIKNSIKKVEEVTGKTFGDINNPLLFSVRSGARASMPGMMDSVHFVGMNDAIADNLAIISGNPRFAYDTYRRSIQTYVDIVESFDDIKLEKEFENLKKSLNVINDQDLSVENLKYIISEYKKIYKAHTLKDYPQDVYYMLFNAIKGVFKSWNGDRAIAYRRINNIPSSWGTAVNVQENVFGNLNDQSGTGVAFSRNPSTGEKKIFGEYLINAQGDDIVAGIRTPLSLDTLKDTMPDCYNKFLDIVNILEKHYKDMQDMEFTIENGKLYMLQCRNGKRTASAAVKIACDMVDEGLINKEEALLNINASSLDQLLHQTFDENYLNDSDVITTGLAASPGAGYGKIVFTAEDAKREGKGGLGEKVILVRDETTPEDIEGMQACEGILTIRGGMTSHAAVVARGMGTCCISGCKDIILDYNNKCFKINDKIYHEGDIISLNGSTGKVYGKQIPVKEGSINEYLSKILLWADEVRKLKIRVNADTTRDTKKAIELGCEGIGLCRTEHMFFEKDRIPVMQEMILSNTYEERVKYLNILQEYQKTDFKEMYKLLQDKPMTIRYLDPPLHEFLPKTDVEYNLLSKLMNISIDEIKSKCKDLKEINPMMGHRGCRLDVTYPEIAIMQTKAVFEAAIEVSKEIGINIKPEIMIPLTCDINEFRFIKNIIVNTIKEVENKYTYKLDYEIGTMIEIPRAALLADQIASEADFFSFGTNDLTQLTYGFSRDDAGKFLNSYFKNNILEFDPFVKFDQTGVGMLVILASKKGKTINPNLHIGVCGEHGGDPESIEFFNNLNFDYVSLSPYRIPTSRLAAAQAAIKSKNS